MPCRPRLNLQVGRESTVASLHEGVDPFGSMIGNGTSVLRQSGSEARGRDMVSTPFPKIQSVSWMTVAASNCCETTCCRAVHGMSVAAAKKTQCGFAGMRFV